MEADALDGLQQKAGEAAQFLKLIANEHRLLILCHLAGRGEMTVNALADQVGLSQSALSQHLARLREDDLVTFRRESQTLYYRISDVRTVQILETMKRIFCP
jgi:DNA-binding transcriptional ArsR family regulator